MESVGVQGRRTRGDLAPAVETRVGISDTYHQDIPPLWTNGDAEKLVLVRRVGNQKGGRLLEP